MRLSAQRKGIHARNLEWNPCELRIAMLNLPASVEREANLMVDVFLSYKREDSERAKQVVDALSAIGLTAWWDRMIPAGANWDKTIETTISQAQCVIVLWSKVAVLSDNVRCEADFARDAGLLIPAKIEDCELPLFHRMTQWIDLQTWTGNSNHQGWQSLCGRVKTMLIRDPRAKRGSWGFGIAPPKPHIWQRYNSAARLVLSILRGSEAIDDKEGALCAISEVKGLFNRVRRKDQWDWFIVWQRFGLPPVAQVRQIVAELEKLRNRVKEVGILSSIDRTELEALNTSTLILRFLGEDQIIRPHESGLIFVLAAKENPDVVLVGATKEDVVHIADDLTHRLGTKTPFGIVHAWPVRDVASARVQVFDELSRKGFSSPLDRVLSETRVLDCDYRKAVAIVDAALKTGGLLGWQ